MDGECAYLHAGLIKYFCISIDMNDLTQKVESMKFTDLQNYFKYYHENEMQFSETTRFVYVDKKCKAAYSFVYANLLLSICSDFEALTRYCFEKRDDEILEIEQIIALLESDEYFSKALSQEVELDGYGKFMPMNVVDFRKHKVFA